MTLPPQAGRAAAAALARRELIRFLRQPTRVAATIGTPILIWVFIAAGMSGSFAMPNGSGADISYGSFLLPGVVTMSILFSTIFSAISLIQDRQEGFLQAVLVSPAPAWAIVASKVLGGAAIASMQSAILLLAAPFIGLDAGFLGLIGALVAAAITAVAVVALGLAAAWWIDSTAGFHGVMNMLLMPLWLLSGSIFPAQGSSPWLRTIIAANPLHWCHAAIAACLGLPTPISPLAAWSGLIAFATAMFIAAALIIATAPTRTRPM